MTATKTQNLSGVRVTDDCWGRLQHGYKELAKEDESFSAFVIRRLFEGGPSLPEAPGAQPPYRGQNHNLGGVRMTEARRGRLQQYFERHGRKDASFSAFVVRRIFDGGRAWE